MLRRSPLKAKRDTPRRNEGRVAHERMRRKSSDKGAAERKHMDRVAAMPCCGCGARDVQVHHVISDGYKRLTRDHRRVVPLCIVCHVSGREAVHAIGHAEFTRITGIDLLQLSDDLWSETVAEGKQ